MYTTRHPFIILRPLMLDISIHALKRNKQGPSTCSALYAGSNLNPKPKTLSPKP